jgi:hypothetical protein
MMLSSVYSLITICGVVNSCGAVVYFVYVVYCVLCHFFPLFDIVEAPAL